LEKEVGARSDSASLDFEVHGPHRRIFTDAEEQVIADQISAKWLLLDPLFRDATFVEIATAAFLE
jgi:hypothetical protein